MHRHVEQAFRALRLAGSSPPNRLLATSLKPFGNSRCRILAGVMLGELHALFCGTLRLDALLEGGALQLHEADDIGCAEPRVVVRLLPNRSSSHSALCCVRVEDRDALLDARRLAGPVRSATSAPGSVSASRT